MLVDPTWVLSALHYDRVQLWAVWWRTNWSATECYAAAIDKLKMFFFMKCENWRRLKFADWPNSNSNRVRCFVRFNSQSYTGNYIGWHYQRFFCRMSEKQLLIVHCCLVYWGIHYETVVHRFKRTLGMLKTDNLLSGYPFTGYRSIRINIRIRIWLRFPFLILLKCNWSQINS